jgi:ABC-type glycerol-3-phosphate transport system substrate-binding protein
MSPIETSRMNREQLLRRGIAAGAGASLALGMLEAPIASASADADSITVLNWHTQTKGGLGDGFKAVAAAYTKASKVGIKFDTTPSATYLAVETTRYRAKKLADVVIQLPGQNYKPIWPALMPFTKSSAGPLFNQLSGWSSTDEGGGKYFGVPLGAQGVLLYGNKAVWKKAGLDPSKPPTTWADFLAVCEKLKSSGVGPIGISGADAYTPWWFWSGLNAQFMPTVADLKAFAAGKIKISDPQLADPLNLVAETYTKGYWQQGYQDAKFSDIEADFISGKLGIVPGIIVDIMSWTVWDAKMGKDAYFAFPMPHVPGSKVKTSAVFLSTAAVASVNKASPKIPEATAFAKFMGSRQAAELLLLKGGQFPNRTDVDVSKTGSKGAVQIAKILRTLPVNDVPQDYFKGGVYSAALQKLVSSITSNGVSGYLGDLATQQAQS